MTGAALAFAALAFFAGSVIKGMVGFALPLVALGALSLFLPAKTAIAVMLVPLFVSNILQAVEAGPRKALETARRFKPMVLTLAVVIFFVASLVVGIDDRMLFLFLGMIVLAAAGVQLLGWRPRIPPSHERGAGIVAGFLGGVTGGLAGAWGAPVILYLTGLGVERDEQVRAQGLTYLIGSLLLIMAHARTGLFDARVALVSLAMVVPTVAGLMVGQRLRGRLDPEAFRRAVLLTLVVLALNMLRKAVTG